MSFLRPAKTTINKTADETFDRNVRAVTKVMYDPKWTPRIRRIRRMELDGNYEAAGKAMTQLLRDAATGEE